jgi:N-acetyl-anhydromuramyl-L-alanine amidase AmpD
MSLWLLDLADVIRAAGLPVVEYSGWTTRARSSGGFPAGQPTGIVVHHTASSTSPGNDAAYIAENADVAPISQLLLDRTGTVTVIAAGAANHAGSGGPWRGIPPDQANTHTIGIEASNNGVGEPWPQAQTDAYITLVAALASRYEIDVANVITHHEWAPSRKIDPAGPSPWAAGKATWPGNAFRTSVNNALNNNTPAPQAWPKPGNTLTGDDIEWIQNAIDDLLTLRGLA